jgi:hypothetical protein
MGNLGCEENHAQPDERDPGNNDQHQEQAAQPCSFRVSPLRARRVLLIGRRPLRCDGC